MIGPRNFRAPRVKGGAKVLNRIRTSLGTSKAPQAIAERLAKVTTARGLASNRTASTFMPSRRLLDWRTSSVTAGHVARRIARGGTTQNGMYGNAMGMLAPHAAKSGLTGTAARTAMGAVDFYGGHGMKMGLMRGAATYAAANTAGRLMSGGGLMHDKDGNFDIIGVPLI